MSRLRQGLKGGRRTTLSIDADTHAALAWLRGHASTERVSASRLLRDAAAETLAKQGRVAYKGEVLTYKERGERMDAEAAARFAGG